MRRAANGRRMSVDCAACGGAGLVGARACEACHGTGDAERRCRQCWRMKPVVEFRGRRGSFILRCISCQETYSDWSSKTLEERERATSPRARIPEVPGLLRVRLVVESGNRKTGPIPVSSTSAETCPRRCPLRNNGCYAEQHMSGIHWRRLSAGGGATWEEFLGQVRALPAGQLWRHNEAGDLPGDGDALDVGKAEELARANGEAGARGFTYTHKPLTDELVSFIGGAREHGFTVNVSTDSLEEADVAAGRGLPTTVVLPNDAPAKGLRTPGGRTVVICPAELRDKVSCATCGLCAVDGRKSIVGFRAHGDRRNMIGQKNKQLRLVD